jgi:hypothetical protein
MDWIDVFQERGQVAGCSEYGNEPSGYHKMRGVTYLRNIIFSRRTLLHGGITWTNEDNSLPVTFRSHSHVSLCKR